MRIGRFAVNPYNAHYDGAYSDLEVEWRRICAVDKATNLERMLGGRSVETVLEVGCGTGSVLAEVARRGIGTKHVGVDLTDPKAHSDPGAAGLDLRVYDGVTLPFADGSFDLVFASHVVEHVPNPRGLLSELARVAHKLIYVEVPCELHARATRAAQQAALNTGHINAYTPESFLILLQTSNVDVIDLEIFDHTLAVHSFNRSAFRGRLQMALRRVLLGMNSVLASRIFCYHCGALAQPLRSK